MIKLEVNNSNKAMAMMRLVESYKQGIKEPWGFTGTMSVREMEEFSQELENKIYSLEMV